MNSGKAAKNKWVTEEPIEELDYEEEDYVDIHGEADLVGDILSETESLEDGECESNSEDESGQEEIDECIRSGNLEKLKRILKEKEQ